MHMAEASPVKWDSDPDWSPRAAAHLSWTLIPPPADGASMSTGRTKESFYLTGYRKTEKWMRQKG